MVTPVAFAAFGFALCVLSPVNSEGTAHVIL
jgi:hypothetical protein